MSLARMLDIGRTERVIPRDVVPVRRVMRWVEGDLWRAVSVERVHGDRMEWHVWVGVSHFLEPLKDFGRMGLDVRCGEDYRDWPLSPSEATSLWIDPIRRAMSVVAGPIDILEAFEARTVDRDGCVVGPRLAGRSGSLVQALVLAEHLEAHEDASRIRAAIHDLKGTSVPGTGEDGLASAKGWAREIGKALGTSVLL